MAQRQGDNSTTPSSEVAAGWSQSSSVRFTSSKDYYATVQKPRCAHLCTKCPIKSYDLLKKLVTHAVCIGL